MTNDEQYKADVKMVKQAIIATDNLEMIKSMARGLEDKYPMNGVPNQILLIILRKILTPDEDGYSDWISLTELTEYAMSFKTRNGQQWCRSGVDGYVIEKEYVNGAAAKFRLGGFIKQETNRTIPTSIKTWYKTNNPKCAILDVHSNNEIDHKDGTYENTVDVNKLTMDDFQPLSKSANDAKRQHCKVCKDTGKRFDATVLGYKYPFVYGDETSNYCKGCYWYDVKEFNNRISEDFKMKTVEYSELMAIATEEDYIGEPFTMDSEDGEVYYICIHTMPSYGLYDKEYEDTREWFNEFYESLFTIDKKTNIVKSSNSSYVDSIGDYKGFIVV